MASTATVRINVEASTRKAASEIDKLKKQVSGLATTAGWKSLVTGVGVGIGLQAYNALAGAITGVGDTLIDSVRKAAEEEAGIARLSAALQANVAAFDGNTSAIERTIKSRQDLAFADDELRSSLAVLVGATHDVERAFALQSTAMDLARLKNISLEEASTALIRVEAGQYRMLKSLGIVLKEGATQTEAIAAVQAVAAGQAEAYSKTTQGAWDRLGIATENLKETVGGLVAGPLADLADSLTGIVEQVDAEVVPAVKRLNDAFGGIENSAKALALFVAGVVGGIGAIAAAVGSGGFLALKWLQDLIRSIPGINAANEAITNLGKASAADLLRAARAANLLKDDLYEIAGIKLPAIAGEQEWQRVNRLSRQTRLLKDDLYEGAAAAKEKAKAIADAGAAAASAAEETRRLSTQVREARAELVGIKTTAKQLASTFAADWAPALLTSAQAATALRSALGKTQTAFANLRVGSEATRAALVTALGNAKTAALAYFEAVHRERLADLARAKDVIQSELRSRIAAVEAGVAAFRDGLDRIRTARQKDALEEALRNAQGQFSDPLKAELRALQANLADRQAAEEESRLRDAIRAARTRRDRKAAQDALNDYYERASLERLRTTVESNDAIASAQQNLDDFLADQQLAALSTAAQARVTELNAEIDQQQALYDAQVEGENRRYEAQVAALAKLIDTLTTSLDSVKDIWDTNNKQVLALLGGYVEQYRAAGAALAAAFSAGVGGAVAAASAGATSAAKTATTAATTAAKAATKAATAIKTATTTTTTYTSGGGGGTILHRASGGPVAAGRTYLVGEQGPEYLTMGSQPGYVTPNGAGGAPVQVNLVVDGKKLASLVDERLFYSYRTAARTGSAL